MTLTFKLCNVPAMRRFWVLAPLCLVSCEFDSAAPYSAPPTQAGVCGTTETLFPKALDLVEQARFAPLKQFIEEELLPTADNPNPDPSWRVVFAALVRLVSQLGLDDTNRLLGLAAVAEVEDQLSPLLVRLLGFIDGRIDGRTRYEAGDAAAHFVRVCDPDHLLGAVEEVLRFQSPSHRQPWLVALVNELRPLLSDPTLTPFLESFEQNAERGRPAIVSLLRQIMAFLANDDFRIGRVEALLEDAVYPFVQDPLELQIRRMVALLAEVTDPTAGIYPPLQRAMRCGMRHGEQRDELLGFAYDLVASQELGFEAILSGVDILSAEAIVSQLDLLADTVGVVRTDETVRDDLRALLALVLEQPHMQRLMPMLIELLESGVAAELVRGLLELLKGCGR